MNKIDNFILQNEPRIIFNYSKIKKNLFDTYIKLNSKIHDNFLNSRHKLLFAADLKYAYHIIKLHFKNRHYFVFIILNIKQLQFIRMQQNSKFANFIIIKLKYQAFETLLLSHNKLFFLHFINHKHLSILTFYTNNLFNDFFNFQKYYDFL